ncbi:MAG: hypothetical protein IH600_15865 [Bacteroidetes bacterium]|nr:hypothetical protein [Bacteroidota bacterium]
MRRLLLILSLLFYTTSCAPQLSLQSPASFGSGPAAGAPLTALRVTTHDRGELLFQEDGWRLTTGGIEGRALVHTADGVDYAKDTTLSYWDAASASPAGRSNTMSQFMLTILGVILVLGLAAIILYAAFLATAR